MAGHAPAKNQLGNGCVDPEEETMLRTLSGAWRLVKGAAFELRDLRVWMPAAALLLPTLLLQLTFPELLRSRLAPAIWTVVVGGMLISWLTLVAAAASWGWVHALRHRRPVRRWLIVSALRVGTVATLGMLAGLLPGLWWQARLAYAPLQQDTGGERRPDRVETWALVGLATVTLLVMGLGQSLAAGLAEALGAVVPAAAVDGRMQFTLRYTPHALTSVIAYAWTVLALTLQAVGVSLAHGEAVQVAARRSGPTTYLPVLRAAWVAVGLAMLVGAVAAVQKVGQHLP
jgi:hypothetical protein